MRFLLKLILAGIAIALLMPFLGPDTSAGRLARAALDDAAGFCERQPDACMSGVAIARDASALVTATIASLTGATSPSLTAADRALGPAPASAPDQTIPPRPLYGEASREAFAGHGGAIRY